MSLAETAELAVNLKLGTSGSFNTATDQLNRLDRAVSRAGTNASTNLSKTFAKVGRDIETGVGRAIHNLERLGLVAGGLAIGGGAAVVKWAGDFQAQLNTINTIAMTTPAELDRIGDGIRDVAKKTGLSLDDLTASYYDLLSAGVKAADAQSVLNNAVTLGIGGLATTQETVDLLTTAYNAYHLTAAQATVATDQFAQAVADGKVKASEIAASFADVASIAKTYKVGIDQIAASYAFLTAQGTPAAEVATEMQRAIISLIKPSAELEAAQKKLKINFTEEISRKGLVPALQELRVYADKNKIPLIELLGRVEAVKFALQTTGPNFNSYLAEQQKILDSGGEAARQAEERQKGFNFQIARLKANLHDAGITIGTDLLPPLGDLADDLTKFLTANQAGIQQFGKDLANALRQGVEWAKKLDFKAIGDDLRVAAGFAKGVISAFLAAPEWLQQAVVTGWGLNKLTGGALVNVFGDLAKGFVGGLIQRGSSPANPLFVVDVGAVGKAVAGAEAVGGAEAVAGGAGVAAALPIAVIVASIVGPIAVALKESNDNSIRAYNDGVAIQQQISSGASLADLQKSLAAVDQGITDLANLPGGALVEGDAIDQLKAQHVALQQQISLQQQQLDATRLAGRDTVGGIEHLATAQASELGARRAEAAENRAALARIPTILSRAIHDLKTALKPKDVAAAVKEGLEALSKGKGNATNTSTILSELRHQLKNTHDPVLGKLIQNAIHRVEARLPGREFAAREFAEAQKILKSHESTNRKIADLKTIEQALKDRGLPHAAAEIQKKIDAAKKAQVAAANATTKSVNDKDLSVSVSVPVTTNVAISGRDLVHTTVRLNRYTSIS